MELVKVQNCFSAPILQAFAYGSAAFQQIGYASEKPMMDLIFVVKDPVAWHLQNIKENPQHYSWLAKRLNSSALNWIQSTAAGVWFNIDVQLQDQRAKYGVTSLENFTQDLQKWKTLYLAGRFHKPIHKLISQESNHEKSIMEAIQVNRLYAYNTALLMLPEKFEFKALLRAIVSISYLGDFRMKIAENPRKIHNIVEGQSQELTQIYRPLLHSDHEKVEFHSQRQFYTRSLESSKYLLAPGLKENLTLNSEQRITAHHVEKAIKKISFFPAFSQSMKGLLTTSPLISLKYSMRKISKAF
jgi:translocator assembly and maintenance protein 41